MLAPHRSYPQSSDAGAAESVLDHLLGDVGMEEQGWATLSAADAEYLAIHHLHQKCGSPARVSHRPIVAHRAPHMG